jgi:hypothetical protein
LHYHHFSHLRLLLLLPPHLYMTKNDAQNNQRRRNPPIVSRRMSYECNLKKIKFIRFLLTEIFLVNSPTTWDALSWSVLSLVTSGIPQRSYTERNTIRARHDRGIAGSGVSTLVIAVAGLHHHFFDFQFTTTTWLTIK